MKTKSMLVAIIFAVSYLAMADDRSITVIPEVESASVTVWANLSILPNSTNFGNKYSDNILTALKSMVAKVNVAFYRLPKKDGELDIFVKGFTTDIYGNNYECFCDNLDCDRYKIIVCLLDRRGYQLFSGEIIAVVDDIAQVEVVELQPLARYPFKFRVPTLNKNSGNLPENKRAVMVTEDNGRISNVCWDFLEGESIFRATLPLDFKGGLISMNDSGEGLITKIYLPSIPVLLDWTSFYFGHLLDLHLDDQDISYALASGSII